MRKVAKKKKGAGRKRKVRVWEDILRECSGEQLFKEQLSETECDCDKCPANKQCRQLWANGKCSEASVKELMELKHKEVKNALEA